MRCEPRNGFRAQPRLFPHRRSQRLLSASGTAPALFMRGAQRMATTCTGWTGSNLPDLSTVCHFIAFLLKHFITYPTKKLSKNRKSSFITVPMNQNTSKAFIIINIQMIPPLQQLFIKISSHFHSEWTYYCNHVIKNAKICALGRLKAFRLYKTFQFWFITQKHCSIRVVWGSSTSMLIFEGVFPQEAVHRHRSFEYIWTCFTFFA